MSARPEDDMMAFLVNGTLDAQERAALEAEIAADPALAEERAAWAEVRAAMQAEVVQGPGAFGLARLMRDVAREEAAAPVAAAPAPARVSEPRRAPVWLWQVAAAVALVALVGQGLWLRREVAPETAGFELAAAPVVAPEAGAIEGAGAAFQVIFAPGATEAQIRALLLAADLEIVGGPGALGLYRLAPMATPADLAQAEAALRGAVGIVESVESVDE